MKKASIGAIIAAAVIIPIAVYAISPYFTESSVDEALPDNVVTTQAAVKETQTAGEGAGMPPENVPDMQPGERQMAEPEEAIAGDEPRAQEREGAEKTESKDAVIKEQEENETAGDGAPEPVMHDAEEIVRTYEGRFVGVGDGIHDASGIAKVIPLDDGSQILRLEEFRSTNGPGLYVYLATDKGASEFVSLGKLKANQGNQNYDIPDQTDLEKYDQVLIWCEPFSVLFGSAALGSQ